MTKIEWGAGTPGPWDLEAGHVQRDSGGIRYWQVSDGQDAIACNQFCYAGSNPKANLANARAIAEVPAMVQALRDLSDNGPSTELLNAVYAILSRIDGEG